MIEPQARRWSDPDSPEKHSCRHPDALAQRKRARQVEPSCNPPSIEWHGFLAPGYVLKGANDAQRVLEEAHGLVSGAALKRTAFTGLTDARFRGLYGSAPGLVYGARAENIHGIDERVSVDSVRRLTQTMALFIADWCGVEPV